MEKGVINYFEDLSFEEIEQIILDLDVQSMLLFCGLSEKLVAVCESKILWRNKYQQLYGKQAPMLDPRLNWKQHILEMGVVVFGENTFGQLGLGDIHDRNVPERISNFLYPKIIYISAGGRHTMCIDEDGNVWGFGDNDGGRLGLGPDSEKEVNTPQQIAPESFQLNGMNVRITQVSAGSHHTVCLDRKGNVWTFGVNYVGELGLDPGFEERVDTPQHITPESFQLNGMNVRITQVSAGGSHTVCLDRKGNVWGFGLNDNGQLGLRPETERIVLTPKRILRLSGITHVSAGGRHTMCIDRDGNVWGFGNNKDGQLGLGPDSEKEVKTPQQISSESFQINGQPVKITKVSAGAHHTVFIDDRGNVWLLGRIYEMTIYGKGQTTLRSPRLISRKVIPPDIIQVSAGEEHTVLLDKDMNVWTLGVGETPQVGGMDNINEIKNKALQVSAGRKHTVLIGI